MPARLTVRTGRRALLSLALLAGTATAGLAAGRTAEPVDESALRYYAALKQQTRVDAESRRIQRLHPDWRQPADLADERPGTADESALWELFAADRLDELTATIAARKRQEPNWQPSSNLLRQVRRKDLRLQIGVASRDGRWREAADLASARRTDLDPADVALGWTVAEAFARADRVAEAAAVLRAILEAPGSTPAERLGSLQAALGLLPISEAEPLVALAEAKAGPEGLGSVGLDVTRARMVALLREQPGRDVVGPELATFQNAARVATDSQGSALVAWYAFRRRDWAEALTWFKLAIARGGDATVAHGLAHTLRKLGFTREAEDVAYAWREPLVNNTLLFIDLVEAEMTRENPPAIESDRIARFAQVTLATASGEGAQALAWYAYNTCQTETALEWFTRAVAWFPKEATVEGYALTLRRLGRQREFVELVNRYDGLFPRVVGLMWQVAEPKPLPCEAPRPAPAATGAGQDTRFHVLPSQTRAAEMARAGAFGRVPGPGDARREGTMPLVKRTEFPIPVPAENDARFASTGGVAFAAARAAGARPREALERPLLARRVPGVGPMPYERFGFSLLPASSGQDKPSVPSAADRPAPVGTLWAADLMAADTQPGVSGPKPTALATASAPSRFQHPPE